MVRMKSIPLCFIVLKLKVFYSASIGMNIYTVLAHLLKQNWTNYDNLFIIKN